MSQQQSFTERTKPKYDWYETDQFVFINVLVKQIQADSVQVHYEPKSVSFCCQQQSGTESAHYQLDLSLNGQIDPAGSSYRVLSVKAELKLKKVSNYRWSKLECQPDNTGSSTVSNPVFLMNTVPTSSSGPDSSTGTGGVAASVPKSRNWDQYLKEVEQAEKDEESGVEDLFKKIYSQGDEEIRKAMNKSFVESGGTVLSTNWNEVGRSKVEMKPPESCEFKKWN